jgi:adenylate cyclase
VSGAHRWADRYDRELSDVFAVQDDVRRSIVALLAAYANRAETERTLLKPPAACEAYDYYVRGADAYGLEGKKSSTAALYASRRLLE